MTGRRARHAGALLVQVACSVAGPLAVSSAAADDADGIRLAWDAPPGCPDREAVERRLTDALQDAAPGLGAGWRVHGRVREARGDWVLVLELRSPHARAGAPPAERVLTARHCDDLGEAAAVAIAIALGDGSEAGQGQQVRSSVAESSSAGPSDDTPAPPRAARVDPVLDRAEGAAAAPERPREPVHLALAADGVLDSASLGGLGWGASVEAAGWWRRFGLAGYGLWLAPRGTELGSGQRATFSLLGGGLRLCYRAPADWLWVSPCVGAELASFAAGSDGLRAGRDASELWLAGALGVAFGSRVLEGLGLHSRIELVLPRGRQEYLVDDQVLHRVPAATLRWFVGVDLGGG